MMFTIVLAVIVAPFAVAWADTATDPSSTTTPDLAALDAAAGPVDAYNSSGHDDAYNCSGNNDPRN